MLRPAYLLTLVSLQITFAIAAVPPLTRMLSAQVGAAAGHGIVPAIVQLASCSLAALGLAVVLNFPAIALLRHLQRGVVRFRGIPHWAVGVALCGTVILVTAVAAKTLLQLLPVDARTIATLIERPAFTACVALMAAGALCAELLRRSVAPPRSPAPRLRFSPSRIEVTQPRDLRTRAT